MSCFWPPTIAVGRTRRPHTSHQDRAPFSWAAVSCEELYVAVCKSTANFRSGVDFFVSFCVFRKSTNFDHHSSVPKSRSRPLYRKRRCPIWRESPSGCGWKSKVIHTPALCKDTKQPMVQTQRVKNYARLTAPKTFEYVKIGVTRKPEDGGWKRSFAASVFPGENRLEIQWKPLFFSRGWQGSMIHPLSR